MIYNKNIVNGRVKSVDPNESDIVPITTGNINCEKYCVPKD